MPNTSMGTPGSQDRRQLARAVIASTIGTTIEWYDFFLYSSVTGLVFARLYFPNSEPLVGTLQAFGVCAVGFLARPIGAFIFGHYGDRIGRKSTLIATLLLMGLSTFAVALVPTYDSIGIWGAVLLTALRFIQGVGVGGEWGGSVLMAMEWAKTSAHRGFIASWPHFVVRARFSLPTLALLGFSPLSGDAFLDWGWRIRSLLSVVLVFIALYTRLPIFEPPAFARLVEQGNISRAPAIEVLRRYPREVLLTAARRFAQHAAFYIITAFIFVYGTQRLGVSRDFLLGAVMTPSVVSFFTIPFFGWLSDRIGRKRMYSIGNAALGAFGFVYFALLDTGTPAWIFFAIVNSMIPHDMVYGPQAAMFAECFPARLRYSGASLGYHLASVVAGGPAPLIAVALLAHHGSVCAGAGYIFVSAIVSLAATLLLPDYTNKDISAP